MNKNLKLVVHVGNAFAYVVENQEVKDTLQLEHGFMYLLDVEDMSLNQLGNGNTDPYSKLYLPDDVDVMDFLELPLNYLNFGK